MQFEAEVPNGMRPGDTFMAQTSWGIVPVQVPAGARPGQKVQFLAPPTAPSGTPVLLGTVVGMPDDRAQAAGSSYRPGRVYRADPMSVGINELPLLRGIPERRASRKVEEIRKGALIARESPPFPQRRPCRDGAWALFFIAVCGFVIATAVYFSGKIELERAQVERTDGESIEVELPPVWSMVVAGVVGAVFSLVAALAFACLAQKAPGCVVWSSLIFGPTLWIFGGFLLAVLGVVVFGSILIAVGALQLCCIFSCFRAFIPFMIKVVEAVSSVLRENPLMLAVSALGSVIAMAWALVCGLAIAGVRLSYRTEASSHETYAFFIASLLITLWGLQVLYNLCHVTYCGVFGRWYFGVERGVALRKSLWAAATTSLGSICFGAFLVAAVRTLEAVVRNARANAAQDGNLACCVVLLVVECVVSCVGDFLEYFNEWAYVQCAVRGVSFIQAARITYSMITCANVEYIVQDLLINSVVTFGSLFCGAVGGATGAGTGFVAEGREAAIAGAIIGTLAGLMAGGTAVGVLSSGTKTLLVLWAEDPEPLRLSRPALHQEFERRILSKLPESE